MQQQPTHDARFEAHKACVLIPTYNNATTLGEVIRSVLSFTSHLVVAMALRTLQQKYLKNFRSCR
jgi:hypothetical protein